MISALSGSPALSLVTVFGRGQAPGGMPETPKAQPAWPEGFEGLFAGIDTEKRIAGLDEDGDGKVNAAELTQALAKSPDRVKPDLTRMLADLVASLNGDGDQAARASEPSTGLSHLAQGPPPTDPRAMAAMRPAEKAAMLIDALDADGDRAIDARELQTGLTAKEKQEKSLQELLFTLLLKDRDSQDRNGTTSA